MDDANENNTYYTEFLPEAAGSMLGSFDIEPSGNDDSEVYIFLGSEDSTTHNYITREQAYGIFNGIRNVLNRMGIIEEFEGNLLFSDVDESIPQLEIKEDKIEIGGVTFDFGS